MVPIPSGCHRDRPSWSLCHEADQRSGIRADHSFVDIRGSLKAHGTLRLSLIRRRVPQMSAHLVHVCLRISRLVSLGGCLMDLEPGPRRVAIGLFRSDRPTHQFATACGAHILQNGWHALGTHALGTIGAFITANPRIRSVGWEVFSSPLAVRSQFQHVVSPIYRLGLDRQPTGTSPDAPLRFRSRTLLEAHSSWAEMASR